MLARSFDDDPMFRYLLPDDRQRAAWLAFLFGNSVELTLADGGAWTSDAELSAAILMAEPGRYPFQWSRGLNYLVRFWDRPAMPVPTWQLARAGLPVQRALDQLHCKQPHVYVYVLGVDPGRQGSGAGGKMMRHALARADALGVALYLETTNPQNLGFYRHFGLEVTAEVACAPGAPAIWGMLRAVNG